MQKAMPMGRSFGRCFGKLARATSSGAAAGVCLLTAAGCYHSVPIVAGTTADEASARAPRDSTPGGSGGSKRAQHPTRCAAYFLLVENALPRAVEIYEVGHMNDRFVAYAQIGITELPMTESSQQFVAMSSGELMAASSASEVRPGDRVALQRSCRPL